MGSVNPLVMRYVGCSGRLTLGTDDIPEIGSSSARILDRAGGMPTGSHALQWLHPSDSSDGQLSQPVAGARLLLAGAIAEPCDAEFVRKIVGAVTSGNYEALSRVEGEFSGCVVTAERVFLFRSLASGDQIFYRRKGRLVEWSSNPLDLVEARTVEFDREVISRSCRGENVFVYPELGFLRSGRIVILDPQSTRTVRYEQSTPLALPRRTTLRDYADLIYDAVLQSTRSYARSGHVGVLLSGGVDSAIVTAALVDNGATITAYHMGTDDPLADESNYARQVCQHLDVPLVRVPTDLSNYFSSNWEFPHPFNHVWYRRIEQLADRIERDGVRLVVSGLASDIFFGPMRYGLNDVMFGDLAWRSKWQMLVGLLSSRWELRRIIRSIVPSYSLYDDPEAVAETSAGTDFLTPMPDMAPESYDLDFIPQEHTLNLAVWRPRGIFLSNPMNSKPIRQLAARMPNAYRLIPFCGRTIDKPALRLAAASRLPLSIWGHYGRNWLASPDETWCLEHPDVLSDLIGRPDSDLVKSGVVDPVRLATVLSDPQAVRRNAENLLCSGMVELFLNSVARNAHDPVRS